MANRFKPAFLFFLIFLAGRLSAVVSAGYYESVDGKNGQLLKTAFFNIIKTHTVLSYSDLWIAFRKTDMRADGKVWDIYSNTTNYDFGTDQDVGTGGNVEGTCYNREHSFPNSWFFGDKSSPMYTDLFHMYPSDKWVNGKRGNAPFGNVETVIGYSANHYCKWGTSTASGATLAVFEPADEMKGDFARTYFYMVTAYEDRVASWKANDNTEMLSGDSYPAFSPWALKILLEWNRKDPVSAKEKARNDSIYVLFQHNRNPYIDFPSLAEYVWGDSTTYAFHPSHYASLNNSPETNATTVVWSKGNDIFISTIPGEIVEVYDISGKKLFRIKAEGYLISRTMPGKGIIFINAGGERVKFCVE